MFKERIAETPLTTSTANRFFSNKVVGNSYLDDNTFLSTLRAIVYPKMSEGETLSLSFRDTGYRTEQVKAYTSSDIVRGVSFLDSNFSINAKEVIRVHCFSSIRSGDGAQECFDIVKDNFEKMYSGWKQLHEVTVFFKKIFPVLCFVNPELKSSFLFVVDIDIRRLHFMQAAVFAYLPWYFDREKQLSDTEIALINTLTKKESATAEGYLQCLQKIADDYNFRELEIREKLYDFETLSIKKELENSRTEEQNIRNNIQDLNSRLCDAIRQLTDKQTMIMGLEQKVNSGDESELMEYFICNKNLVLRESKIDEIIFSVREYLDYFDEDMAKSVIDNKRSYVYYGYNSNINDEDIKELMEAIFIRRELKARVCATYRINLRGNARAMDNCEYASEFNGYMPNIHLDKYSCLGNYGPILNELLAEHEYIGAIEQCVASCKSLNFGDSTVMGHFMTVMRGGCYRGKKWKFIELPDGSVVTPEKAVEYLNNKE